MNVLSKLSIKNLMLNKKRTISTIIGIILSVALICGVATLASSMQATLVQNAINEYGYYHLKIGDIEKKDIETFENNRDIEEEFEIGRVGDAVISDVETTPDTIFFRIFSMTKDNFDKLQFKLLKGRFPANSSEIVINKRTMARDGGADLKLGEKISFDVGEIDYDERVVPSSEKKTFTIVGIIDRPNTTFESYDDPYTVITTGIDTEKNDLYIALENPKEFKISIPEILGGRDYEEVREFPENMKYPNFEVNRELLRWEDFAFSDSTVAMLYSIVGVVLFVIIFTSVFCIRNSFAIATTEKIKMYGMLASVGATKKQIRHNVIFECMVLGLIGIPVGIISGVFAIFVLLKIVNSLIGNYLLAHVEGIIFNVSILPIVVAVVLGVITIYLSAIASAIRASKVSPIENLRGSKEIKLNSKKLKTPKVISKVFKTGGVLAYKNLKRSKRKYRTTVTSIAVSIFIFITLNAFITNAFELSGHYYEEYDYKLAVQRIEDSADKEKLIKQIISLDDVQEHFTIYSLKANLSITDESKVNREDGCVMMDEEFYDEEKDEFIFTGKKYFPLELVAMDDYTFRKYAEKIDADYNEIKDTAILCDYFNYYNNETKKNKTMRRYYYNEGDMLEGFIRDDEFKTKVGKITDTKPYYFEGYDMTGGFLVINTKYFSDMELYIRAILIDTENPDELETEIKTLGTDLYVNNYDKQAKEQNGMIMVVNIFLYGFISVITLIGVTNIFNTITSNMELRQKEFAMLKSIGMTKKEFNNMINLETLFYGSKAWIYGTILGLIGTYAMYRAFEVNMEGGNIYIPTIPIIISAIFVFVFIFVIMKYSIAKINKQNTIETIRKENI